MASHSVLCRGVSVAFPYSPYDQQVLFMERVIQSLQNSEDALLESPTGTGKTICLLAASLSWREQLPEAAGISFPKLIYASRTHSQLTKVISELKGSGYSARMTVMGSRQQLCVNSQVEAAKPAAKNGLCRSLVSSGKCKHYDNVQPFVASNPHRPTVVDIEDMVAFGRRHAVCPYYLARSRCSSSDIAFMPYNYLIDSSIRKVLDSNDLDGSVLIFDEAHNLDAVCADAASFELQEADLAGCVDTLRRAMDTGNLDAGAADVCREVINRVSNLMLALKQLANGEHLGSELVEAFRQCGLTSEYWEHIVDSLETVSVALASSNIPNVALQAFTLALRTLYEPARILRETPASVAAHYRMHVSDGKSGKQFCYWCFHPGIALRVLRALHRIRCVILASGTLSPMESWSSEMGSPFPVRLENTHVIQSQQIWAGVVSVGPSSVKMDHSYNNRQSKQYLRDLGSALVNFARITPAGMLVFFPSYGSLEACVGAWHEDGSYSSLAKHKKIVIEPRLAHQCGEAIADYQAHINDKSCKGAVFLAVCRGKVSEGLDFADGNGRAVIIVGIPNPNTLDPKVVLKKKYLDQERRTNPTLLSGDEWYNQQAACAVNQAVGRIIRHRFDYGAMIFLDCRFEALASNPAKPFVSAWIRPYVKTFDTFGKALTSISRFFQKAPEFVGSLKEVEQSARAAATKLAAARQASSERKRSALDIRPEEEPQQQPDAKSNALERKKKKMDDARAYIELAKASLDVTDFRTFQDCLRKYKAQEVTCATVWTTCLPLFQKVEGGEQRAKLFGDFEAFLPPASISDYRKAVRDIMHPAIVVAPVVPTPVVSSALGTLIEARSKKERKQDPDGASIATSSMQTPKVVVIHSQTPPPTTGPVATVMQATSPVQAGPKCLICQEAPKAPFSAKCGHICCFGCWNKWLEEKLECPACKEKVR